MENLNFYKKFIAPEFRYLLGKNFSNLIFLFLILLFSILSIGISEWAISFLDKKMNSPFVSLIEVYNPDNAIELREIESDTLIYSRYGLNKNITQTNIDHRSFYSTINENWTTATVRRAVKHDPFIKFLNEENFFVTDVNFENKWGCIVSIEFLESLGYSLKNKDKEIDLAKVPHYIRYKRRIEDTYKDFFFPISGVVNQLPHKLDMIVSEKLFDTFTSDDFYREIKSKDSEIDYLKYYTSDAENKKTLKELGFRIDEDEIWENNEYVFYKDIADSLEFQEITSMVNRMSQIKRIYNFSRYRISNKEQPFDYFNFTFEKDRLGSIRNFQKYLKDNFSLEIDLSVVQSKENFSLFNKVANMLRSVLIFYSIFSIIVYIINLIVSHISKSQKSLGTLKAFGLSNNSIIFIYSFISVFMIVISFSLSFLVSEIAGAFLVNYADKFINIKGLNAMPYINIPLWYLVFAYVALPSIFIFFRLRNKIRGVTPGDLIYGR